jgi:hypothetical protein
MEYRLFFESRAERDFQKIIWFYPSAKRYMLSDDEVALLKAILTALRGIKIRDIDKALVVLSKGERQF